MPTLVNPCQSHKQPSNPPIMANPGKSISIPRPFMRTICAVTHQSSNLCSSLSIHVDPVPICYKFNVNFSLQHNSLIFQSMPILVIPMPIPSHYWGHSQAQPRNKRSIRDGPWSSRRMNLVQIHQWKLIQKSAYKSPSKNNISNCIGSALAWNPTAIGAHFGPEKRRVTAAGK